MIDKIQQTASGFVKERDNTRFDAFSRSIEIAIWYVTAIGIIFWNYPKFESMLSLQGFDLSTPKKYSYFFQEYYFSFIFGIVVFLFPILFLLIFGKLPLENIRHSIKKTNKLHQVPTNIDIERLKIKPDQASKEEVRNKTKRETDENILVKQIREATQISEKIFIRSGTYLLVGCLIAFIGVFIFYSPMSTSQESTEKDITKILIDFLPRIGALFFVEYVAFFFLKQYRIMLEEYRYYEAIKRTKQNNYVIVSLVKEYQGKEDLLKLILEKCNFTDSGRKLSSTETTETLEVQKLSKDEFNVVDKFLDLIKELKK